MVSLAKLEYAIDLESISVWSVGSSPTGDMMLSVFSKNTTTYCFLQNKKLFILVLTSFKG
jgi:hypothetical protein